MSQAGSSTGGSAIESQSGRQAEDMRADEANAASLEHGLFGVLFTVSKEKAPGKFFVGFRLFMDWIQVFLLVVNPAYGWNIDSDNRAWQIFNFIQLNAFMSARGYMFFLVCMYILAGALAVNLGLCVWVSHSFKTNNFEHVWPIVILRIFSLVFYQVLDIASLTLFLMTMDCQYFFVPDSQLGHHAEFPSVMCWTMPHMIHVGVAALSVVVFYMLATLFTMAEIELNPLSHNPLGMAHTKAEVYAFTVKTVMTCVSVFINGLKWMAAAQLLGAVLLVYLYLRWLPHLHAVVNYIRVGCFSSVLWAAFLLMLMALQLGVDPDDTVAVTNQQNAFTAALWAGFIPMAFIGAGAAYLRTQYYVVTVTNKFRDAPLDMKPTHIHEFEDPRLVELASRCCRVWVARDVLDEERVQVAERIIRAGMSMLHHPYMAIWWSSFLIDVRGSYQSGYVALQAAKKMPNASFLERFCIFIREQEHTQKASAASSGDNASADLVSYVEFQRNYRLVLRLHTDALTAKKLFWETLLHSQTSFSSLAKVVAAVDQTVRQSERMYKQVLQRHSNSVKLLVLYVKFLKFVKNDPWSASRWGAEAEKLQVAEEEANEKAVLGEGDGKNKKTEGFDESKGIIIMQANSIVRMVNDSAASMLGYHNKSELVGKNINIIVPPPFSRNHNNYVRNYIETGVSHILDTVNNMIAVHKDRYVVPVKVLITRVSGIGEDSVFMGLLQPLPCDPEMAHIWLLTTGHVLSCDGMFTDWLGYKQEDIHMKHFRDMVSNPAEVDQLLATVRKAVKAKLGPAEPHASSPAVNKMLTRVMDHDNALAPSHTSDHALPQKQDSPRSPNDPTATIFSTQIIQGCTAIEIKHSFMDDTVQAEARLELSGVRDNTFLVVKLRRPPMANKSLQYLMVVNDKGKINHITRLLAERFGTTASRLQGAGMAHALDNLIPDPFVKMHQSLSKTALPTEIPAWSCRSGMTVPLDAIGPGGPCVIPFKMAMKTKEIGKERITMIQLEERTHEQMCDERRMSLIVNSKGVVVRASPSPGTLFDMDPQALVGCPVAHILDILRAPVELAATQDVSALLDHEEQAVKLLHQMAQRSYDNPGMSWRVGVGAIIDPLALVALGPMGQAMLAKETIPAVMVVQPHMDKTAREGARAVVPKELQYCVELWRTDMISGVLEVDANGMAVQNAFVKCQSVYSPHLLLGLPPSLILGTSLPALIASTKTPTALVDALFSETGVTGRPSTATAAAPRGPKSGMRGTSKSKRELGPIHTVKLRHGTDGLEVEVHIRAMVKQDMGVGCSLYLAMHAARPRCGRSDFASWLPTSPDPVRPRVESNLRSLQSMGQLNQSVNNSQRQALTPIPAATAASSNRGRKTVTLFQTGPSEIPSLVVPVMSPFKTAQDSGSSGQAADGNFIAAITGKDDLEQQSECSSAGDGPRHKDVKTLRIASWISSTHSGKDGEPEPPEEDELSEDEESEKEDNVHTYNDATQQQAREEHDATDIDEAGTSMQDFKRGKRLKKLIKLLESPMAVSAIKRFKGVSLFAATAIVLVDLVMFVVFLNLVNTQSAQVVSLRQAARAGSRVMQIAQLACSVELLLSSRFPLDPNMKYLGMGKVEEDIQANLDLMFTRISDLDYLHHGIYRGFATTQALPNKFGLRQLWDDPSLSTIEYYLQENVTVSFRTKESLWSVGNKYIQSASAMVRHIKSEYPASDQDQRWKFANDTDLLYILYNGPNALVDAYASTLDGLMQVAVEDAKSVNNIQLMVLGIEGCFVALVAFLVVCIMASRVVQQRYVVFDTFLKIPQGVIKAEATRAMHLVEGGEEEDDEEDNPGGTEDRGDAPAGIHTAPGDAEWGAAKIKISTGGNNASNSGEGTQAGGFFQRTMTMFSATFRAPPKTTTTMTLKSSHKLVPSNAAILQIAWPFLFWVVFVIVINAMGWKSLSEVSGPIAISNIVQFVSIQLNKVVLLSQRYVSEQYLNPNKGYITEPDIQGSPELDRLKTLYKADLAQEYKDLLVEYDAMMFGRDAVSVANSTSPHFQLATKGIMFDQDANYIFQAQPCLAENSTDCLGPDSDMYPYLSGGLDQAIKHLFYSIDSLLVLPNDQVHVDCLPFDYIYEAGNRHIIGALEVLIDVYSTHVRAVYQQALTLHIIALVVCIVTAVGFIFMILLPACKVIANERRRVAELLSHLPPEVDVENMVSDALHSLYPNMAPAQTATMGTLTGFQSKAASRASFDMRKK